MWHGRLFRDGNFYVILQDVIIWAINPKIWEGSARIELATLRSADACSTANSDLDWTRTSAILSSERLCFPLHHRVFFMFWSVSSLYQDNYGPQRDRTSPSQPRCAPLHHRTLALGWNRTIDLPHINADCSNQLSYECLHGYLQFNVIFFYHWTEHLYNFFFLSHKDRKPQ